jgi:hypothetical protein
VRRGLDPAEIHSIALSPNLQWLAVCSDKGTLHVFSLRARVGAKDAAGDKQSADQAARSVVKTNTASNTRSSLSFMNGNRKNPFQFLFLSFGDGGFAWSFKSMHYMI